MSKEFKSGSFRTVEVGYSYIQLGKAIIPKDAKVIGYSSETKRGVTSEYVIYILEENIVKKEYICLTCASEFYTWKQLKLHYQEAHNIMYTNGAGDSESYWEDHKIGG